MRQQMTISRKFLASLILGLFVVGSAMAQPAAGPATGPATQPGRGARGPRGASGAASKYPREQLPFTNSEIANIKPGLPTLFICGDSTAARNGNDIQRGWGAMLIDYFDTDKVNLVNFSQAGINFPGYYQTRWPQVVAALKPGDVVVVELGHNQGHLDGTGEETGKSDSQRNPGQVVHTYGWYFRTFIREGRAKGAIVIVSSTTTRNIWTNPNATISDNGVLQTKNDNYNPADDRVERGMGKPLPSGDNALLGWAKQVATEEKAPFLDHSNITADVYQKMGREAVTKLFIQDHTHTTTEGAQINAETFVAGLKALPDAPLVQFLNDKGKAIPAYVPAAK